MIAQGSHASMKVILDLSTVLKTEDNHWLLNAELPETVALWIKSSFTKICLYVDSEAELLSLYEDAKRSNIICALITDSGKTEFGGVPTNTCIAIGPHLSDEIDKITGHLKLL